jgi:hypothetical protein
MADPPPWALFEWLADERFDQMLVQARPDEVEDACRPSTWLHRWLRATKWSTFGVRLISLLSI